ncbi:MAG TPA: hypothetical protein VIK91_23160 [Nannocystis sp.]
MDLVECAFCQLSFERRRLRRDHELDFCDPCACGHALQALRERGHIIERRTWETTHRSQNRTVVVHHLEITAQAPGDFVVTATFTRENFLHKLVKLFHKEIEVGDPIFDDLVFIRTDERAQTLALLQNTGVQSALLTLVGDFEHVKFLDGAVVLYKQSRDEVGVGADVTLAIAALLVHLERGQLRQS